MSGLPGLSPITRARASRRPLADSDQLARFPEERSAVADALTYCDLTTGPGGEPVSAAERLEEIVRRYGTASLVAQAITTAADTLLAAVARTEARLARVSRTA